MTLRRRSKTLRLAARHDAIMSDDARGGEEKLAPVVPLFGGTTPGPQEQPADDTDAPEQWHVTWRADSTRAGSRTASDSDAGSPDADLPETDDDGDASAVARRAETRLVRALAARGLSEREARDRLRRDGVEQNDVEEIIERLMAVGVLDDRVLAEQIVYQSVTRKNQGRRAVAQTLSKRGISRDEIDIALEALPDDDYERALEFAQGKAPSLARLDRDTALRRLIGQLSRRGYGGSLAMSVAKQAIDESGSAGTSRVRFR